MTCPAAQLADPDRDAIAAACAACCRCITLAVDIDQHDIGAAVAGSPPFVDAAIGRDGPDDAHWLAEVTSIEAAEVFERAA